MSLSKLKVNTTISFEVIEDNFSDSRGVLLVGGTRSGKTIAILQWIIVYCLRNTNKEIVICRDTLTNVKRTLIKDFQALCYGFGNYEPMYSDMTLNKSEMYATINGNNISFIGLIDDPMRVYGLKSDIFYINEAVSTYKSTFNQLNQRCVDGWILDCNPSEPNSWVYKLPMREDVVEFRTTYEDNPFLAPEIIKEIESYEPTVNNVSNGTADERMWSIYGKGLIFKGKEIVFPKWNTYINDPTEYDYVFYGLDWGFNDAMVVVKLIISDNDLYIREIIYGSGIDDFQFIIDRLMKEPELFNQKTYIVCDTSEPRSIITLQKAGLPAMKTKKGQGSILGGIRKVNSYNIHIEESSKNVINEFNNYKFKVDKKTDTIMDVPVDKDNHACDAIRYPLITFL